MLMRAFPSLPHLLRNTLLKSNRRLLAIATLVILSVVFALAVAYYLFDSHLARQKKELDLIGAEIVANFDQEVTLRTNSVSAMRKTAEQYLMGRTRLTLDPTRHLRRIEKPDGYALDIPPGYGENDIGNITGAGAIPASNTTTAREMAMTLGLLPLFQTVVARDQDTPWVYYTSQNRFTHIYPRVSPRAFCYTDKSLEYDVFTMASPKNNPQRKIFWTPPYRDEAGKGMMVTVAAPVYEADHFRGSVAIDIALSKMKLLLVSKKLPDSRVYLYTEHGAFLAGAANDLGILPAELPATGVIERGDDYISQLQLKAIPWRVLLVTSQQTMFNNAVWYALPYALVVLSLFASLTLLMALLRTLRKVQECSIRDGLTGLYNRGHFDTIAGREMAGARRDGKYFGLIMLDIDYFKRYNDSCGHQAGDGVLKKISSILSAALRRPVDLAFRVGGEEFAILTKAERPEQIEALAQRLNAAIMEGKIDFSASPHKQITVSVGVATISPGIVMHLDEIYARADRALYRAKNEGRNQVSSTHE